MNRGDARLLLTILATAVFASVITMTITRLVTTSSNTDARLHAIEQLEQRLDILEAAAAAQALQREIPTEAADPIAAQPIDDPLAVAAAPEACDEVSCVLNNYEASCCAQYKKGHVRHELGPSGLPENLDRAMISDAVGKVKARVMQCGQRFTATGVVKLSVRVTPSGDPGDIIVKTSPEPGLGACVSEAMSHAHFERTELGGSFGYPFVF